LATIERDFPPDHAAAQGHFPGNPIIPGALLLSEALRAIETSLGKNLCPYQIRSAKFIRPVRPGERVSIDFSRRDEKRISFSCKVGASTVLAGEVICELNSVER
jgi:3-hydroxymyristoyl/3-hydroxydecanoyl-(acyl carrier protein) dehydratase